MAVNDMSRISDSWSSGIRHLNALHIADRDNRIYVYSHHGMSCVLQWTSSLGSHITRPHCLLQACMPRQVGVWLIAASCPEFVIILRLDAAVFADLALMEAAVALALPAQDQQLFSGGGSASCRVAAESSSQHFASRTLHHAMRSVAMSLRA